MVTNKLEIVKKHILSFKELKPRAEPKPTKNSKALGNYEEKRGAWEREESQKDKVRQILLTKNGYLVGGSQFRCMCIRVTESPANEDTYIVKSDYDTPNFTRILERGNRNSFSFSFDVKGLLPIIEVVDKALGVTEVKIENDQIYFSKTFSEVKEPTFLNCSTAIRQDSPGTMAQFKVRPSYFVGMLKLAKRLKINDLTMKYEDEITPLYFTNGTAEFNYIIAPVR